MYEQEENTSDSYGWVIETHRFYTPLQQSVYLSFSGNVTCIPQLYQLFATTDVKRRNFFLKKKNVVKNFFSLGMVCKK